MQVSFKNVSYRYFANTPFVREALRQVTLTIPTGSFTTVMGANGSGKTTLLQMIAGMYTPDFGTLAIGNKVYTAKNKVTPFTNKQIGYVFQYPESQLFETTVGRDISFGPSNMNLSQQEVQMRVDQAMAWVDLPLTLKERSPFQLSGGQRRRVAIAGVLAMNPQVLILDEPTTGLDPLGQKQLLDRLYRFQQEQNITVIMVTHRIEEAIQSSDHLIVMKSGQCIWQGRPDKILGESEIIKVAQLDLPEITQIIIHLNQQLEIEIPLDIFSVEQLEPYLRRYCEK